MKVKSMFLLIICFAVVVIMQSGCSRIEIKDPENDQFVTPPHTLIVQHTGCGSVEQDSFEAWLDRGSDMEHNITGAFSFQSDVWTAESFPLEMGKHTLTVRADVSTSGWCSVGQAADTVTFYVAPCSDFDLAFGMNFEMAPDTITLVWGEKNVEKIANGETKVIQVPENSPFLIDGKLPATAIYAMRNTSTSQLKFNALLKHAGDILHQKVLVFCDQEPIADTAVVVLKPSSEPLKFWLEAGDIFNTPSDDTRPVFFLANLQVRVYPL